MDTDCEWGPNSSGWIVVVSRYQVLLKGPFGKGSLTPLMLSASKQITLQKELQETSQDGYSMHVY